MTFSPKSIALLSILAIGLCPAKAASLELYEVPAISSLPRLPDERPPDALGRNELHFTAAKGEFEPASLVAISSQTLEGVEVKVGDLTGEGGTIPAANLDVKIVKVWYQDGTAWYSYFGDPARKELIPELLLNDERLIRVDREKKANYLRVGAEYESITYPHEEATEFFNYFTKDVADAETLQPFTLEAGQAKQIWATLKMPGDAAAGIYRGSMALVKDGRELGKVEVRARVLPFELPEPKTYYDLEKPFFVSIYRSGVLDLAERLKIPREQSVRQQRVIFRNLMDHGVFNIRSEIRQTLWGKNREVALELLRKELELLKEVGSITQPLLSIEPTWMTSFEAKDHELFQQRMRDFHNVVKDVLGHTDIYATSWDEAGFAKIRTMRDIAHHTAEFPDLKLWVTAAPDKHLNLAGYLYQFGNHSGWPNREEAAKWHAIGSKVASYASPHLGPENPNIYRRWEGLARYKENYDGSYNYKYYSALHPTIYARQNQNVWNDSTLGKFRGFNMIYPTKNGVIDTIAWEGFREGIDDIRYATLLKERAAAAMKSGDQKSIHLGRKALMWLEVTDMRTADLDAVRYEMINYILELGKALNL